MSWVKFILFLAGIGLFAWLIKSAGPRALFHSFQQVGWPFLFLFLPYLLVYLFDAIGWQVAFHHRPKELGFVRLFLVRTAGESLNNTLPSAYLGGEPVKALLLKRFHVDMAEAASSVIVAKTTMTIAQIMFILGTIDRDSWAVTWNPASAWHWRVWYWGARPVAANGFYPSSHAIG
jgi:uncharacterized membrane protein YbhN (UPF0104 family)